MISWRRYGWTVTTFALAGALTVLGLLATARAASAEITGACNATLNGANVAGLNSNDRGNDIRVTQTSSIPVVFTTTSGFASHQLQLEFAGRGWPISQKADNGAKQFTETANVADYAKHGVGLYKLIGVGTLTDGSSCSGAATIDVAGDPLSTTAGQAATGALAVGTVMGLFSMAGAASSSPAFPGETDTQRINRQVREHEQEFQRKEQQKYTDPVGYACGTMLPLAVLMTLLMFPVMALAGEGGGLPSTDRPWRAKPGLRITLLGLVGGVVAGLGAVVLMQQYSIAYPTLGVVLGGVVGGALLYGVVLPSIGRLIATGRINRRLDRMEHAG